MASTASHTIVLWSNNQDNMMQRVRQAPCKTGVTITPGMLIAPDTGGVVKPHASAGANAPRWVAIENPWSDHGNGLAIDHAYAAGETVFYIIAQPGDQLHMFLEDEGNVAAGAALESNGAGALQALAGAAVDGLVAYAAEAVNNTGGSGNVRIRVDIA